MAARGRARGKGYVARDPARAGHADLAGALKYGHADVRNALERERAPGRRPCGGGRSREALLREIGVSVAGSVRELGGGMTQEGMREATDDARRERGRSRR